MRKVSIHIPYQVIAMFGPDPCGDNGKEEVIYHCPECINRKGTPDTKGKLYVNTKTLKYHCFRCEYKGQIGRKIKVDPDKLYGEDQDSLEVDELIKDINSIEGDSDPFDLKIPIDSVFTSKEATEYLIRRGFTERQLEYYDMRAGNLNQEFGRIIIPNQVNKLVYTDFYSARTYIDQKPKYHNPGKEKSKLVFNLHRQKEGDPIIVVEGALTAVAAGYHAVATLGKTMTRDQASLIIKKHPSVVYVNYDYGAESYADNACQLLKTISPDLKVYNVLMKDDRDAADLSRDEYLECLKSAQEYVPVYQDIFNLVYSDQL